MTTDKTLMLPEEISIANISQWHSELSDLLQQASGIDIDASDLSRLDTAAVQLLTVFSNTARDSGVNINWLSVSDNLKTTAQQLGLDQLLFNASQK
ncbi:STAS domain-containing protein [Amphritea sp. HPY]|uniref:STAS domain-containing protein n=1 Tax=Amphritea sp. HPY TaxID=3421652 RepID=UPI003D7E81BA